MRSARGWAWAPRELVPASGKKRGPFKAKRRGTPARRRVCLQRRGCGSAVAVSSAAVTCARAGGCVAEAGSRGLPAGSPPAATGRGLLQSLSVLSTPAPGRHPPAILPGARSPGVRSRCGGATDQERWPWKGKEDADSSAVEPVRSRHLLDAVARRALSRVLQPVPGKDASGSFGCCAGVLHIKYFNKWICQEVASATGTHAQGEETQEAVYLCVITTTPHSSFAHQFHYLPDP